MAGLITYAFFMQRVLTMQVHSSTYTLSLMRYCSYILSSVAFFYFSEQEIFKNLFVVYFLNFDLP